MSDVRYSSGLAFEQRDGLLDSPLNDQLIRNAMMFCEVIDVPSSQYYRTETEDLASLSVFGVRRTAIDYDDKMVAPELGIPSAAVQLYRHLDDKEPFTWSIWTNEDSPDFPNEELTPKSSFEISLNHCLLIPHRDVPYEDILSFRERRRDELLELRHALDLIIGRVREYQWDVLKARTELAELDLAVTKYLQVAREPNWRKSLATLKATVNAKDVIVGGVAFATAISQGLPLPSASAAFGTATLASIGVKSSFGLKDVPHGSPYRYFVSVHRDFS